MRSRAGRIACGVLGVVLLGACGAAGPLGRQYEYQEQVYLKARGGATVVIHASIPALVALRGVPLDPSPKARVDQDAVKRLFQQSGCTDIRQVGQPWRRKNRWFIEVRIETPDVNTLGRCGMLAWSTYRYERDEAGTHYEQTVGAPTVGKSGAVNWDGSELVAFRLHAPSRVVYHNLRRLDRDEPGEIDRGNILTWEQHLSDRRAGKPLRLDVRMESQSILRRTLTLFAGAFISAALAITGFVWLLVRRGRARARRQA
jgi:hypothetical protein